MKQPDRKVIKESSQEYMEQVIDLVHELEAKLRPPSGDKVDKLTIHQDFVIGLIDLIFAATEEI